MLMTKTLSVIVFREERPFTLMVFNVSDVAREGQLMNGLSTRIDLRHLRLLFHAKWNETPPSHREFALAVSRIDPCMAMAPALGCGVQALASSLAINV